MIDDRIRILNLLQENEHYYSFLVALDFVHVTLFFTSVKSLAIADHFKNYIACDAFILSMCYFSRVLCVLQQQDVKDHHDQPHEQLSTLHQVEQLFQNNTHVTFSVL